MKSEQNQEAALIPRLLMGLVAQVCRSPHLVLAGSLLLAGIAAAYFFLRIEYRTQRSDLISASKDYQQRWREYVSEFGNDEDVVVIVEGTNRPQMIEALEAVAARIAACPNRFDRLFYKVDLRGLQNRSLLYLDEANIRAIDKNLASMKLLLETGPLGWRLLTLQNLLSEARGRAARITPGKALTMEEDQFLGQLLTLCRSATATLADPAAYKNPWQNILPEMPGQENLLAKPQYFFSGDGNLAFLLARPHLERQSFTAATESIDVLRGILTELRPKFAEIEFGMTGLPVLENDEMTAAQEDTHLASWLALAGVAVLFFIVYRSVAYPVLTVMTLLVGTAWAMGWLTLTVGHLNILSATFAVMLIGMGDYGVLWVMRYEQARQSGMAVPEALLHTARHVAVGNLTAASTLALAFFAAVLADFQAVAELGWIAGCGVLLCAFACFTTLPAALMVFDRRRQPIVLNLPSVQNRIWLPRLAGKERWVLAAGLAVAVTGAGWACRIGYDHNLLNLQARNLDSVKWEMKLIEKTAGASWHTLSVADSREKVVELKARYEKLPEVSRVVEAASLIPGDQEPKLDLMRSIRQRLRNLPERGTVIPHAVPDVSKLQAELLCLMGQLQPLADTAGIPLLDDLRRSLHALQASLADVRLGSTVEGRMQQFEQCLARDLAENMHRLRDVTKPEPITRDDLPAAFRERYVSPTGKWLLRVFARDCLWDFEPLEHFTKQIQTIDPGATGKPFATVEGLKAMRYGFQRAGIYAFLVIVAILWLDFRGWREVGIALAPLLMGLALALGIMGLCGVPLNPANMIAFPLILGVGIDNGVHVLHDSLIRRRLGLYTISHAIGRGVLVKALTTLISFGTLMAARERGLASLGFVLTLGVGSCMTAALVFLPALLGLMKGPTEQPFEAALEAPPTAKAA